MTTAVDTNIIVALWNPDSTVSSRVRAALDAALDRGLLVAAAPVFAELLAGPGRDETFVDAFARDTGLIIDWNLDQAVWRAAGRAFSGYAQRRRKQPSPAPRRILADFLIGAHALRKGYPLLTLDRGIYRAAFPELQLIHV